MKIKSEWVLHFVNRCPPYNSVKNLSIIQGNDHLPEDVCNNIPFIEFVFATRNRKTGSDPDQRLSSPNTVFLVMIVDRRPVTMPTVFFSTPAPDVSDVLLLPKSTPKYWTKTRIALRLCTECCAVQSVPRVCLYLRERQANP